MSVGGYGLPEAYPRYCLSCGEIFSDREQTCPACGVIWRSPQESPAFSASVIVVLLTEFRQMYEEGSLDRRAYANLRSRYEAVLLGVRPRRAQPADPVARPAAESARPRAVHREEIDRAMRADEEFIAALRKRTPPPPPKPPGEPLLPRVEQWAAARQADILLYLGAFLLSVSALIFVGYRGSAVGGLGRFATLAGFTLAFLLLGIRLPHWERVREAGVVFRALGVLLTPVSFIALRTQVFGGSLPASWIWLAGAFTTASLCLALGLRGFGRLYLYPGAVAVFVAWGALAAVLGLPPEWFGAWFALAAVLIHLAVDRLPQPQRERARLGSEVLGAATLIAAQISAGVGGQHPSQLPVTYLLITADLAATTLARRASARTLAALPALVALTALTACWSSFGLGVEWYGAFLAAAALGYLASARFDAAKRTEAWQTTAAAAGVGSLVVTHAALSSVLAAHQIALPLTYAELLVGACFTALRWRRREALAAIPLLAAGLGVTGGWALRVAGLEWIGAWGALAAAGYLAAAELDAPGRKFWQAAAGVTALVALAAAHIAAAAPGVRPVELPFTYALVLVGALWAARRQRGAVQMGLLPSIAALLGLTCVWAVRGTSALHWFGAWAAAAGLGYLVLLELDRARLKLWRGFAAGAGVSALVAALLTVSLPEASPSQLLQVAKQVLPELR